MIDLTTHVAMMIAESDHLHRSQGWGWDRLSPAAKTIYLRNADAAITAVFDTLIDAISENTTIHNEEGYFADLGDWISCQRPTGNDYRGDGE